MNDTNTMTVTGPKMITKFCANEFVKNLVKEARRVKYTVTKDDFGYTIMDDTNVVLTAMKFNRSGWLVRFSSMYWTDMSAA